MTRPRLVFLVNEDKFFVSHRFEIGVAARDAGFDVLVAAGGGEERQTIEREGMRFELIPFDRGGRSVGRDLRTLASIHALYARERPTLVHHVTIKAVLYGSIVARSLRVPAVVNAVSGLGFVFLDPSRRGRALRFGIEHVYRAALAHPKSTTIFQNTDDRRFFVERGLVSPKRARLVRGSGVDVARFPSTPLPSGVPIVLLPARLLWDKGVREFVDAARILRAHGVSARFVVVGGADGTNPASVPRREVERWVEDGTIEWWGHRADMPEVYRQAHLVVLPSYREGFPLALLEAGSSGRACITTDVPGCRDAIRDGATGWLVPVRNHTVLAETIERAVLDRAELCSRGDAAAAWVRRECTRDGVVQAHMAIYRELAEHAFLQPPFAMTTPVRDSLELFANSSDPPDPTTPTDEWARPHRQLPQ